MKLRINVNKGKGFYLKELETLVDNRRISMPPPFNWSSGFPLDITLSSNVKTVIENINDDFFIYRTRPAFGYTSNALADYIATVRVEEGYIEINIKMKKSVKLFVIFYILFCWITAFYLLKIENPIGLVFLVFPLGAYFLFFREKRKFKTFITNLLLGL